MAELFFSIGGVYYLTDPVKYEFQRDTVMDYNHEVKIDLKQNIGKYVKTKLYFDAKWMMISEVQFFSGESLVLLKDIFWRCKLFILSPVTVTCFPFVRPSVF